MELDRSYSQEVELDRSYSQEVELDRSYSQEMELDRSYSQEVELDRSYSQEANTTHHKTSTHFEPSGQKETGSQTANVHRSRSGKSRIYMEITENTSPKLHLMETSC